MQLDPWCRSVLRKVLLLAFPWGTNDIGSSKAHAFWGDYILTVETDACSKVGGHWQLGEARKKVLNPALLGTWPREWEPGGVPSEGTGAVWVTRGEGLEPIN